MREKKILHSGKGSLFAENVVHLGMRLIDKLPQFQNQEAYLEYLTNSVWATMHLENQGLSKEVMRLIVKSVLYDRAVSQGLIPQSLEFLS